MRRVDNSMHRKSRRLLKNIVILPVENSSHHTDNAKKCGAQKIADTLCTRMLGKSPVCQNSGVGKKGEMLESCQHHQQRGKKQPERIVYMEMSPVEIEPTTYCLGERKSVRFRVPPSAYIFPNFNVFHHFRMFAFPPKTACFTLFVLAECQQLLILAVGHFPTTSAFVSMFVQYLMTNCLSLVNSYYETLALNAFLKITIITDFQCHF